MTQTPWLALISSAVTIIGGPSVASRLARLFSTEARLRDRINRDLDLIDRIGWNTAVKHDLQKSVERRVSQLIAQGKGSWDATGLVAVAFFALMGLAGGFSIWKWPGWWSWPIGIATGFCAILAIGGFLTEWGNKRNAGKQG